MKAQIDDIDARILDLIQSEFPLDPMPFDVIGRRLSIDSDDVLARIARLKSDGIIRQISAIFDSASLGYHSALVAFRVLSELLDRVASEVSEHDGVSHCYSRDADYNLWFTLTLAPEYNLQSEVARLAVIDGVLSHMLLPTVRVFKIGVFLKISGEGRVEGGEQTMDAEKLTAARQVTPSPGGEGRGEGALPLNIENAEVKAAVRALQADLPLVARPFSDLANEYGLSEDKLLNMALVFLQNGVMRRYSAVLRHGRAGYTFNAMICWRVSTDMISEVGEKISQHSSVSHCYQRPTYPDWPYSLYTMVHARSQEELDEIISDLMLNSLNFEHLVLKTLTEYKKQRILYFQ
ncbi:MAG: Lrp/AsnC family transcriptional regulator [Armatimonadota bacterium]